MSLGFGLAGHEIKAGFDNWDKALDVYCANFNHPVFEADLNDVEGSVESIAPFAPDMIIGGPPCQDFSSAGKRDEDNGRGDLTVCFARIVSLIQPEWFVMENVARIVKTRKLVETRRILDEAGYGMTQYVLDASLCGVPQARKRFFLVGKKGEKDNFLLPFIEKNLATKPMTIAEYLGNEIDFEFYYRHPRSYVRRGIFSVHEPSPTIRGVNRPMPKGYPLHPGDPVESLEGIRALTAEERARIQTFPGTFKFSGNKTDKEQMIGNAVPVNLARFVGETINEYVRFNEDKQREEPINTYDPYRANHPTQLSIFEPQAEYIPKQDKNRSTSSLPAPKRRKNARSSNGQSQNGEKTPGYGIYPKKYISISTINLIFALFNIHCSKGI